jgi:hypothetical protein
MRKLVLTLLTGAALSGSASAGTLLSGLSNAASDLQASYEELEARPRPIPVQLRPLPYGPGPYAPYDPCYYCGRHSGDYITPEERQMQRSMRRDYWQYNWESRGGWRRWGGRPY